MQTKKFNVNIAGWDVTNVQTLENMFFGLAEFNPDLCAGNDKKSRPMRM